MCPDLLYVFGNIRFILILVNNVLPSLKNVIYYSFDDLYIVLVSNFTILKEKRKTEVLNLFPGFLKRIYHPFDLLDICSLSKSNLGV
jgi:hypothetical protein